MQIVSTLHSRLGAMATGSKAAEAGDPVTKYSTNNRSCLGRCRAFRGFCRVCSTGNGIVFNLACQSESLTGFYFFRPHYPGEAFQINNVFGMRSMSGYNDNTVDSFTEHKWLIHTAIESVTVDVSGSCLDPGCSARGDQIGGPAKRHTDLPTPLPGYQRRHIVELRYGCVARIGHRRTHVKT